MATARRVSASEDAARHKAEFDESLHALPGWFAWFQKTFGLSFLVLASAYLLGNLATLGWVPSLDTPTGWGLFRGAGVVLFFLAGVAVAGIGLTCSVVFVAAIRRRTWFLVFVTGVGMLVFFGVEMWASLSERSADIHATPADRAVLQALGVQGVPPMSPTAVVTRWRWSARCGWRNTRHGWPRRWRSSALPRPGAPSACCAPGSRRLGTRASCRSPPIIPRRMAIAASTQRSRRHSTLFPSAMARDAGSST